MPISILYVGLLIAAFGIALSALSRNRRLQNIKGNYAKNVKRDVIQNYTETGSQITKSELGPIEWSGWIMTLLGLVISMIGLIKG